MPYTSLGTSINFVDRTTVVPTPWVQDVNNVVYGLLGNGTNAPTSVSDILNSLGLNPVTLTKTVITATLGQTLFTVPTYVPGTNALSCFINGVRQTSAAYTEVDSNTVAFVSGATSAGDTYEFVISNVIVTPGVGTVTSVGLSLPAMFTVSGSPVTSSGTLSATLAAQTQNQVFVSPNGLSGVPTFRSLVAADLPTVTVAKGGTNLTSLGTANQVLGVNNGASALEYKTIASGTNISVVHTAGTVTINTTGLGTMATQNASSVAITGGTASSVTLTAHREKVITANSSTAYTVDASTGEAWKLTMTGNCTLTLSGQSATDLTPVTLYLIQDATGNRTMTWPASVKWGTAGAPTLSTAAGKIDIITLFTLDNGTTWIGSYRLGF